MNSQAALVVARTFTNVHDAQLAKSVLEAAAIDVALSNEHVVTMNWMYSNLVGGVKVLVPADQCDEAQSLLDTTALLEEPLLEEPPPPLRDHALDGGADSCPRCGSEAFESTVPVKGLLVFSWLFLGVPLGWPRRRRSCRQCGLPAAS
jgi:hypothetical protein